MRGPIPAVSTPIFETKWSAVQTVRCYQPISSQSKSKLVVAAHGKVKAEKKEWHAEKRKLMEENEKLKAELVAKSSTQLADFRKPGAFSLEARVGVWEALNGGSSVPEGAGRGCGGPHLLLRRGGGRGWG